MQRNVVRIGISLVILIFFSGFIFCPHMRIIQRSVEKQTHSAIEQPPVPSAPLGAIHTNAPAESLGQEASEKTVAIPRALAVISDEELKERNYRSYVYRSYAQSVLQRGQAFPSKEDSKQWLKENFAPALLEQLAKKEQS